MSTAWGFDRGQPVDRYYIARFLSRYSGDVEGRVLEFGDLLYTTMFGAERVEHAEVLDVDRANERADYVADIAVADNLPSERFDCVICTQVLQLVYDVAAAFTTIARVLRPGGVLLATVPGITKVGYDEYPDTWWWSFTATSLRRVAIQAFDAGQVRVDTYGNVLSASAFLYGLAAEELAPEEIDFHDRDFEVIVALRAQK